ncbi:MAG: proline--tRNA ligase [Candidatus Pacearchaeota archaeon]|nr:proline--tRNA ligase [Candidatus Pacearchaeota archaeon]
MVGDERDNKGIVARKNENFSEWFTEVVQKAELADIRYNLKGFLVFRPWSVYSMEKMYSFFEKSLQKKGHEPHFFPTLIPEENFEKEAGHVKGFTPEVFWVTHGGDKKLPEKLALRPTSETAFYQMFSLWLRSYKDLPFKSYQRAQVFRYDTKATRPFLRSREFHWIETHCAFANEEDALNQVKEDMKTSEEVLHGIFCLPFMMFERPSWDKFPGASRTFAADVLNPDGKVIQQPSTHMISPDFSKAFDVKFKDKDEKEKYAFMTCYGPAISRIFASVVIVHGDDKGLRFPWEIAPKHIVIVPISNDSELVKKAEELKKKISVFTDEVVIDLDDRKSPGEKFNYWEMKGIPVRIDLGKKEVKDKKLSVFRRDLNKKEVILEKDLMNYLRKVSVESGENLKREADKLFKGRIRDADTIAKVKWVLSEGGIARCGFCSVDGDGEKCAVKVEKEIGAEVRGTLLEKENVSGKCVFCGKNAKEVVYIAKAY